MNRALVAKRSRRLAGVVAAGLALAMLPGCGAQDEDEIDRGRALFQEQCGACHTLAEAGTSATVGPNLDTSFTDPRAVGMDDSTIAGVVHKQIAHPRSTDPASPDYMPPDLVTGRDRDAVAAYVGRVAGIPDIAPPGFESPQELFAQTCGGCHTLAAAGTQSETGPDLDEVLPGQSAEEILRAIVDPEAETTPGFPPGVMPSDYEEQFSQEELDELVQYLLDAINGNG